MSIDRRLEELLTDRLDPLRAGHLPGALVRRARRRRAAAYVATAAVASVVAGGTWIAVTDTTSTPDPMPAAPASPSNSSNVSIDDQSPSPTPATSGDCETGLWAKDCPEAAWAARIAQEAGLTVSGDTGTALVVEGPRGSLYLWTTSPGSEKDRTPSLEQEDFEPAGTVGDTRIFSDGKRLTWEAQGLYVWVTTTDFERIDTATPGVTALVESSRTVGRP